MTLGRPVLNAFRGLEAAAGALSLLRHARGVAVALAALGLLTSCQEPDWAEREATLTAIEQAHDRGDNAEVARLGEFLAEQCDEGAQTWIGLFMLMGAGEAATPEQRQREGLMLLHEAADSGTPIAQSFLRDAYRKGEFGVPKDENLGYCYKLAVDYPDWTGVCETMSAGARPSIKSTTGIPPSPLPIRCSGTAPRRDRS